MKKGTLIAVLTAIMIMACGVFSYADGFTLVSSYPEDGQTNTSMENLGVKLTFSKPINTDAAKAANADKFKIVDEDGAAVPTKVLFSDANDGLVLVVADIDEGFVAKNNSEYKLIIDENLTDNDGDILGSQKTITFRTYNQRVNNMVNMAMMFIMFGGIMVLTLRQNKQKEEEAAAKEDPKEAAFNPYREAKRTGKTVEEVMAEQAKKEEKLARKRARKNKNNETAPQDGKIENCAELLNNVYHVHAPAPVSKEDRSVNALITLRREEARAEKAAAREAKNTRKRRR